jgi:hypothetical protein
VLKRDSSLSVLESVSSIIEEMVKHPLMIAYSGHVDDNVRKKAKEAGFQVVIENPLTV